ncbi:MAG: CoB--CoM heterodisulfide reductase iron-sulfur subunit B family protein [Anaerolineae bacterium]|nr:CoB--CoM heterodisulfide reductase iron-sulfur subunit B family protein [Anaerolineae bacterium]MCO5191131.1 CoB--CoM heterodisulfide reductase iron-sulfur subunit B family protein [Anaerolineae bacterium]
MSKYLFYPGCSLQRSARPYLDSLVAIKDDLDIELLEIDDWNCCGATEYISVARLPAYALNGRNLALAANQSNGTSTVVAPCSACYLNLAKTDRYMRIDPDLNASVNDALAAGGLHYDPGTVTVRHLLDIIYHQIGIEAIKRKVVRPLTGLRVAPYYGCMIVRPDYENRFGSPEYPDVLDQVLRALGATVVDFPVKTHCCGGHMTQISPPVAYELIRRLIYAADSYQADILATLCPMCQLNLDAYQDDMNKHFATDYSVPIVYFTQLMGLAFGHEPQELGLGKEMVDPRPALAKVGVAVEGMVSAETTSTKRHSQRRRKDDPSLPMPQPLIKEEDAS